ncbi:alpha/beta-hydrolase family protein [Brevibacterium samyangense]|uniref:Alpha/beta-hydrolase family protein n=1 Tax=Brevibacterium samyangense TaxID=366888 RepID=A0ABN2TCZ8_9MICO
MKRIVAATASAASWIALAPSLVPRTWWMTAVNVAVNAYGGQKAAEALDGLAGPALVRARSVRRYLRPEDPAAALDAALAPHTTDPATPPLGLSPAQARRWRRHTLALAVSAVGTALALHRSMDRQKEVTRLTGGLESDSELEQLLGYLVGLGGWWALGTAARLSAGSRRLLERRVKKLAPFVPSLLISAGAGLLWWSTYRWLLTGTLTSIAEKAVISDFARESTVVPPAEPERSGSRESRESFATLGFHGRGFVAGGPRAGRIAEVRARLARRGHLGEQSPGERRPAEHSPGIAARTPIRVFIGRLAHPTLEEAAEAAVAELERAGALERGAILLVTNTGSGWIPQWSVEAFEFLTGGNCASVAVQYSFAGSWLNFLIGRGQAIDSSRLLHAAVTRRLAAIPADRRPKLYATGESLGALGGNGAFVSTEHMRAVLDGAVWTGTPRATPLVGRLISSRRYGSPEIHPMIGRGDRVRFVVGPEDLDRDPFGDEYPAWEFPRILYAQHPSDPIVWWEPRVIWQRPDWLREPRGADVSRHMHWLPWVTFWQLASDMPRSVKLPGGHGHNYHAEVVHYWNAVLGSGVSAAGCARIADAIAADMGTRSGSLPLTDPAPWQAGAQEDRRRNLVRALRENLREGLRRLRRGMAQGAPGDPTL